MGKIQIKLNVNDERMKLVNNYYINGKAGHPDTTTKMVHKDHVNKKGYFLPTKLIKC